MMVRRRGRSALEGVAFSTSILLSWKAHAFSSAWSVASVGYIIAVRQNRKAGREFPYFLAGIAPLVLLVGPLAFGGLGRLDIAQVFLLLITMLQKLSKRWIDEDFQPLAQS